MSNPWIARMREEERPSCPVCGSSQHLNAVVVDGVLCQKCLWKGTVEDLDRWRDIQAAYQFVQENLDVAVSDGQTPMWYGHALRDAYLAGVRAERKRHG